MARPWKHPKTGIYWLRKAVPEDLRAVVGKWEEKQSLRTRDPAEAKLRHAQALAEIEARWANLRAGPRVLSKQEAYQLARPFYDWWLDTCRNDPSRQEFWPSDVGAKLWEPLKLELPGLGLSDVITPSVTGSVILDRLLNPDPRPALERKQRELESWCRQQAAHSLAAHGLRPEEENELTLAKAIGWAMQQASVVFARSPLGHFGEPAAVRLAPLEEIERMSAVSGFDHLTGAKAMQVDPTMRRMCWLSLAIRKRSWLMSTCIGATG